MRFAFEAFFLLVGGRRSRVSPKKECLGGARSCGFGAVSMRRSLEVVGFRV